MKRNRDIMYSFQNLTFKNDSLAVWAFCPLTSIITMTIITPLGYIFI
ncbi:MAG: hypothetical protein O2906_00865 [Bacteroidetes bacterium]|nr:hypothetical protein [Bacteroidota bacterium]MDA0859510.1 hypothetical protein [Bacteroidota bacterium]